MGRFHSAVGYYNAAYHHGSWFETAATRPSMFAAGFIPYHNVGVSSRARVPSGPAGLEVIVEFGNGLASTSRTLEPTQSLIDEDNHKAFNLGVVTQADATCPASRRASRGTRPSASDRRRAIGGAHERGACRLHRWRLGAVERNRRRPPRPRRRAGACLARLVHAERIRFRQRPPYLRYQSVEGDRVDPIFGALGHRYGPVAGVRVDFSRFAASSCSSDGRANRRRTPPRTTAW